MSVIVGDGSSISIGGTPIGCVQQIRFGGGGYEMYDASCMATTGVKPFLQSAAEDGGELTVEYANSTSQKPGTGVQSVTITLSDSTTVTFSALVVSHESTIPKQGIVTHSLRLKITAAS